MHTRPVQPHRRCTPLRWLSVAAVALCALSLPACSDDDDEKPEVQTCDPDAPTCPEGLVCAEQPEDGALCQIPPGGQCDPGAENPNCRVDSECVENPVMDAEPAHLCLVSEAGACEPSAPYCGDGLSCAELQDGSHRCHLPVWVRGRVLDAADLAGVPGAHVVAIDDEGVAVTDIAQSADDGAYSLEIPVVRDAEGVPTDAQFTLRGTAQDYQTFPGGLRTALPVSTGDASEGDDGWVIESAQTDISLIALGGDAAGRHRISGQLVLDGDDPGMVPDGGMPDDEARAQLAGVLIVATGGGDTRSAITDRGGRFTIFNAEDGATTLSGYAAGVEVTPGEVEVAGAAVEDVVLRANLRGLSTVSGNVGIVNAPGGATTSVILVVSDTFDERFVRGDVPRGLRAPRSGPPDVTGAFSIENVPDGDYVVLAAFENDDLVRDPDTNIAGTGLVRITVAGADLAIAESFKITEALAVRSPGAQQPEAVSEAPLLTWADDSSEDWYDVVVYDAFGEEVWRRDMLPGVSGGDEVSVTYAGPLDVGMYYQFRVTSWRQPGGKNAAPISATEDLRGVFYVTP